MDHITKINFSKLKHKVFVILNKRHFRADDYLSLSSALRPRLLGSIITLSITSSIILPNLFSSISNVSASSLTLTIPSSFTLNVTPASGGKFTKSSAGKIGIKTDNNLGYTLSIKAKSDNTLTNGSSKLSSITEQITESNFNTNSKYNNKWGYLPSKLSSKDNTNFIPGPNADETIIEETDKANPSTNNDYEITLGAKVDDQLTAGAYNNAFIISATANAPKISGNMQNWDGCDELPYDNSTYVSLLDTRDNNVYRVAKLADGQCWMIDNLRIAGQTITSEDSDMTEGSFEIPNSKDSFNPYSTDGAAYYDSSAKDDNGDSYGAYYSWDTATTGTGNYAGFGDGGISPNSVCPKGWRLPIGGGGDNNEFVKLDKAMGGTGTNRRNDLSSLEKYTKKPIPGFTFAGDISISYTSGGSLESQGTYGGYWTSVSLGKDTNYGYNLGIGNSGSIYPADHSDIGYVGYSIRCIARPHYSYSITYDLTSGTWDNDKNPNPQVGDTTENTVKLYETVPTRANEGNYVFDFKGWCDQKPITNTNVGSADTCMGVTYEAGKDFPLKASDNNITLYALWGKQNGCFVAGTLVDTPSGPKPIESIGYGDKVHAYDFEHNQVVEDTVDGYYDVERSDVVRLTFENDTSIEGTYPHRFYSAERDEWIQMGEFKAGDPIRTVNGIDTKVKSIESKSENTKVYTLQTEKYHNFFVETDSGDKYIVKAVIPGNWDADDDYLLQRYPILPIPGSSSHF